MVPNHALPLRHLDRMHLVVPRNLSNRLDAHQGFQSHLGLEGACIPFPFSFAHSSAVLSCPAEPEKSNLATGPNYGVHFSPRAAELPKGLERRNTKDIPEIHRRYTGDIPEDHRIPSLMHPRCGPTVAQQSAYRASQGSACASSKHSAW